MVFDTRVCAEHWLALWGLDQHVAFLPASLLVSALEETLIQLPHKPIGQLGMLIFGVNDAAEVLLGTCCP